jgi:hypothetical protein
MEAIRRPQIVASRRYAPDRVALGDTVTLVDGPALHQHLSEPVPGRDHAIGRAIHPGTTVPLGLAIDAAIQAVNGKVLRIGTLRYCSVSLESRVSKTRPLQATARVVALGARHVECVSEVREDERLICRARIGLCQVKDGRAASLAPYYALDCAAD